MAHSRFSPPTRAYRFDKTGKLPKGKKTTFKEMANGVPGIELRLPLLFSEGVGSGRIDLNQFVALTATNHAKLYGLHPRKGTIAVGADADLAIWDPERVVTVTTEMLHDNVGYTPYEGRQIVGWPTTVISRRPDRRRRRRAARRARQRRVPALRQPRAAQPLGRRRRRSPASPPSATARFLNAFL